MSIKKKYMNWMMLCKLPLGASLWAILFFFIFTACQDDLPYEDTEVMMTFTTRAVVTQNNESAAIDIEKMNDLRVIVVRENGDIVYNNTKQVDDGASTATVSFQTPVKTGGENFKFFAIANYSSLVNPPEWANVNIDNLIIHEEGNDSEISINSPIPQTKYWEYPVKQLLNEIQSITKQLDFIASKISVQFINTYDAAQTLSDIYITGITPNGKGRLFNHPTGEKDDKGEEIYEEVYVTENSDVTLNEGKINFETITVDAATNKEGVITPTPSTIKHYYTYPVDNGNISSPILHATWNNKTYELPLEGITELKRNDHLKIVVTLTGHALTINYSIAPWVEKPTNIGSPTIGGGYNTEDWTAGGDVNIGGDPVEPNPGGGSGGSGDYIWFIDNLSINLNYTSAFQQSFDENGLNKLAAGLYLGFLYDVGPDRGRELYIKVYNSTSNDYNGALPSASDNVFSSEGKTEILLDNADVEAIKNNGGGVSFWGSTDVTITKIYLRDPRN